VTDNSGGKTAGAELDVGAPGCKLEAATNDVLTGTSMAGPVAGCTVGLYVADGGSTDLETVREELQRTARPIPKASKEEVGAGMPSAANLLTGTEPEEDQTDAETNEAAARGAAYEFFSGSWYTKNVV
jgi:subtilisin family serine protease